VDKNKALFFYMQELIPVNIVIGDRTYRVRIETGDEEKVRRLIKLINEQILDFKTRFAGKDMQDYIAMVMLWFVTEQQNNETNLDNSQVTAQLESLESLLDNHLTQ
jgi:cell division protein ZapA (FtsZ GTPase activity inhibitor)